jgi:predicted dienelactone hydrolase
MRPLEIVLAAFAAAAVLCLIAGRWRKVANWLAGASLAAAILHGMFEGLHWQMIPAYAAVCVACVLAWRPRGERKWVFRSTAAFCLLLTAASLLLSYLLPMFRLPKPTGPYLVGTTTLYLKDSSRIEDAAPGGQQARELVVQIWYPAQVSDKKFARYRELKTTRAVSSYQSVLATNSRLDAPVANGGAPFPVILFNHGWGGRRTNDTFLTEELASHGYVVASIDHTYNAAVVVFPDGRVVHGDGSPSIEAPDSSSAEQVRADWDKELSKWTADQEFVLNSLAQMNLSSSTPWFGRLNTSQAGAMGHSFGGAAATNACAQDPRIHGAINMDGWFFGAIRRRGANQPLLYLYATTGQPPATTYGPHDPVSVVLNAQDFLETEQSIHRFGGYLVSIKGAEHNDFTDQPLISPLRSLSYGGTVPPAEMENIVRRYVLAFFDKTIRGSDPAILRSRSGPFAETTLEAWPPLEQAKAVTVAALRR